MNSVEFGSEKGCAGDAQQKLNSTDQTSRQRGRQRQQTRNCLKIIEERLGKFGRGSQMGA
jgi:hypothetical protein